MVIFYFQHSFHGIKWEFHCEEELSFLLHLFIRSVIYFYQDGQTDIYFILWSTIHYHLFCSLNYPWFAQWMLL